MLIDYPKEKKEVMKFVIEYIKKKKAQTATTSLAMAINIFEGDKTSITREDGSKEVSKFTRMEGTAKIDLSLAEDVLRNMELNVLFDKLDEIAEEMARQESKMMFDKIESITDKTGNVVTQGDKKFIDAFLEMIEKTHISFDKAEQPIMPTMIVHPSKVEKIKKSLSEENPEALRRYNEILEKKRCEWRDRENSRKLVD